MNSDQRNTPNEARVYLGLFGDFEPDELTKRLGVTPTDSAIRGSRRPETDLPRTAQWEYSTARIVANAIDVYELAEQVVEELEPHAEKIKQAVVDLDLKATLQVVLYFSTDDEVSTPAIGFSNRVLQFVGNLSGSVDIDTYILPDENTKRLILWANDSPLNARDEVIESTVALIETSLADAEKDSCYLNDMIAYVRCLTGVLQQAGGIHIIDEKAQEWEARSLSVFDAMPESSFAEKHERIEDRYFIESVFADLANTPN